MDNIEDDGYDVIPKADWFKIHHSGWLEGSLRYNKDFHGDKLAAFRGLMTDICALVSRSRFRDGSLRYAVGLPMPVDEISKILNVSMGLLTEFIEFSIADVNNDNEHTRIERWDDGTLFVHNWRKYQARTGKKRSQGNGSKPDDTDLRTQTTKDINAAKASVYFVNRAWVLCVDGKNDEAEILLKQAMDISPAARQQWTDLWLRECKKQNKYKVKAMKCKCNKCGKSFRVEVGNDEVHSTAGNVIIDLVCEECRG